MNLHDYFEKTSGFGVLATADKKGTVNTTVYARPHMTGDGEAAFIMSGRRCYRNVSENPSAAYLFHARGENTEKKYEGVRLTLTKVREDDDPALVEELRRRSRTNPGEGGRVVYFRVDEVRPLIGDTAL